MKTKTIPAIVSPGAAEVIHAYGDEVRIHLGGKQNDGAFTMFTDITPPGGGPPPHFHVREDEWWFVLEGQAEFFDGEKWTPVAKGGVVFMPKNSFHTFRNGGDQPLKQIIHTSPAGFETFFKESESAFQSGGAPDMKRILEIGAEFGIYFPTISPGDAVKRGETSLPPTIVQAGQGPLMRAFGDEVQILLDGIRTGGKLVSFLAISPPGGGPPAHFHENEDEWFYVLDGRVSFLANGHWTEVSPGTAVFAPRKSVHTFKTLGDQPSKLLAHASPSGFEKFFAAAAAEFARPGGPDMNRAAQIAAEHDIHFVQS